MKTEDTSEYAASPTPITTNATAATFGGVQRMISTKKNALRKPGTSRRAST